MNRFLLLVMLIPFTYCLAQHDGARLTVQTALTQRSAAFAIDSSARLNLSVRAGHSALNIGGQVVSGAFFTFLISMPALYGVALSAWGNTSQAGQLALDLVFVSSYTFGGALGVDIVAKQENPGNSLWKTLGYSAIGGGVALASALVLSAIYTTIPGEAGVLLLFPLAASMIYANCLADWPGERISNSSSAAAYPARTYPSQNLITESSLLRVSLFTLEF